VGVPYKNCGSLVVAFGGEEERSLEKHGALRGVKNGVKADIISSRAGKAFRAFAERRYNFGAVRPGGGYYHAPGR
jgi:L-2-hydroxyglutarate oxidase LhgO